MCPMTLSSVRQNTVAPCCLRAHNFELGCHEIEGTWCSGITPAQHAGGPGLNPQCVHLFLMCAFTEMPQISREEPSPESTSRLLRPCNTACACACTDISNASHWPPTASGPSAPLWSRRASAPWRRGVWRPSKSKQDNSRWTPRRINSAREGELSPCMSPCPWS